MKTLLLLEPAIKRICRIFSSRNKKLFYLILFGSLVVACGLYYGMTKFLGYVYQAPLLGDALGSIIGGMLVSKLLEMLFMTLLFMLLFSCVISALSSLFLDNELQALMVTPQPISNIFMSRFILMTVDSSWTAIVFFAPIFLAFATTMKAFWLSYILFPIALLFFILIPSIIGAGGSLLLAAFFPIRQMKKVFQFISIIMLTGLIFFLRSLEAEKLLNPSHFETVSNYLLSLQMPLIDYSPTSWIHHTTINLFNGNMTDALTSFCPLFFAVALGIMLLRFLSSKLYHYSWQRSCEAMDNQLIGLEWLRKIMLWPLNFTAPDFRVIAGKEITIFLRDPAVFSQIFMMAAIIVVYAYNLYILPLKDVPSLFTKGLNNALVYLNGPFIGFIVASIGMRFVYPSVSMEGRAFWAVKTSTVSPRRVLIIKLAFYLIPMLTLAIILCAVTNSVFTVTNPLLMYLSYINVLLITSVITALAIGVGSVNANFNSDSALKVAGSYGGFVYMIFSGLYILNLLILEIYPIYSYNYGRMHMVRGIVPSVLFYLSIFVLLFCTAAWIYLPMRKGLNAIEEYEPE